MVGKRFLGRSSLAIALLGAALTAAAPAWAEPAVDPWVGLWRLNSGLDHTAALHLVVSREESTYQISYYAEAFGRRFDFDQILVGENTLKVESRRTGKPFVVQLRLVSPDVAEGSWKLVHPQFRSDTPLKGVRINRVNRWSPASFGELGPEGTPLNLVEVLSRAPVESQAEFERFWDTEVEAAYYPLVQDLVYEPHLGRESRQEKLNRLRQRLTPDYLERARQIAAACFEVAQEVEAKAKELSRKNLFVITPLLEAESSGPLVLEETLLVRISPELPDSRQRGILARLKFELAFYKQYPPQLKVVVATPIRSGLGVHLALSHGFAAAPEETFATWDGQRAADLPVEEAASLLRQAVRHARLAGKISRESLVMLGMGFARQLCESYPPAELVTLSQQRISALFLDYLSRLKGQGDSGDTRPPSEN